MKLRNLTLALLLFILGPCTAYPAWLCDGVNDDVALAHATALNFPDGDYTIAGWVRHTSRTGSGHRVYIHADAATAWWYLVTGDASATSVADDIRQDNRDNDGTTLLFDSTSNPFGSNTNWTHVAVVRSGNTHTIYVNGVSVASTTNNNYDAASFTTVYFCASWEQSFNGAVADWAMWSRALTTAELSSLAQRFSSSCVPGFGWFTPMLGGVYQELRTGMTVTNNGTVAAAHPSLFSCGE